MLFSGSKRLDVPDENVLARHPTPPCISFSGIVTAICQFLLFSSVTVTSVILDEGLIFPQYDFILIWLIKSTVALYKSSHTQKYQALRVFFFGGGEHNLIDGTKYSYWLNSDWWSPVWTEPIFAFVLCLGFWSPVFPWETSVGSQISCSIRTKCPGQGKKCASFFA